MTSPRKQVLAAAVAFAFALAAAGSQAGTVTPDLAEKLAHHAGGDPVAVIVQLPDRIDLSSFTVRDRSKRDNAVLNALKSKAAAQWPVLAAALQAVGGANLKQLWIVNAAAVTLPAWAVQELVRNPLIGRIGLDGVIPFATAPGVQATPSGSWNLDAVNAPAAWALGADGSGVVVASLDTGVDAAHPDLGRSWRGGANSWFDPSGQHAAPYDSTGHGTQTMGLMVGGSASGVPIGMAPGARWIAAKVFDDAGNATFSRMHLAFQWLLDPDNNPATLDAPDIVNASWGMSGLVPGSCNTEFGADIQALRAAGISIVFAAGNDGPDAATGASPASTAGALSAGSVDGTLLVAPSSSRGPSGCDGGVFPKLTAPGVNVVSSDLSFGGMPLYASVSGTSFAAPHVAGALALLASAYRAVPLATIETALTDAARDLGDAGPDNFYGYGLVDVAAAHQKLAATAGGAAPTITSTAPASAVEGKPYTYAVKAVDPAGGTLAYRLTSAPAGMTIDPASGLVAWTPAHAQVGVNGAALAVSNAAGLVAKQGFSVTVAALNGSPVATADSYAATAGTALNVGAPGVLANDRDPDGDAMTAVLATGPAHGTLALNADGSFRYTPATGYSGSDSFTYKASDGKLASAATAVALSVQAAPKPPVAVADSYSAPAYRSAPYTVRVLAVLANDSAAGGVIDAASVQIVAAPGKGGSAKANADGTIGYTPALRFSGTESFSYRVKNTLGQWSNNATVSVKVQ
ncbi:S8 family serine peptidase [Telluria sp. Tellsp104]